MQSKAFLFCAFLAFTSSILATGTDTDIRAVTPDQHPLNAPELLNPFQKEQEDSPEQVLLDNDFQARSHHTDDDLDARAPLKISEIVKSALAEVKKALVDNPDAAESLGEEFSGTEVPEWYAKMPASVTNYYATITPPPVMTGYAAAVTLTNEDELEDAEDVEEWMSDIISYKSKIGSAVSEMSVFAASESREASRLKVEAASRSEYAVAHNDQDLATQVFQESQLAATRALQASVESSFAASASAALKKLSAAPTLDGTLVMVSSIFGAAVCLGFLLVL